MNVTTGHTHAFKMLKVLPQVVNKQPHYLLLRECKCGKTKAIDLLTKEALKEWRDKNGIRRSDKGNVDN